MPRLNKFYFTLLSLSLAFTAFAQTVTIGSQEWMNTNLDVASFRNGDPIPQAKSKEDWELARNLEQPAWCYYNNKKSNGKKFGKLYNGFAITDPRGLAPKGYHIASDVEWTQLIQSLVDSTKAKTILNGLNFNLNPGGYRYDGGAFNDLNKAAFWWSSTEYYETQNGMLRYIESGSEDVKQEIHGYDWGFYVRCIKD